MYRTTAGDEIFVIDGHAHRWDVAPQTDERSLSQIAEFYAFQRSFPLDRYIWPLDKIRSYTRQDMVRDEFVDGHVDMCLLPPTALPGFFLDGSRPGDDHGMGRLVSPERFILKGQCLPGDDGRGPAWDLEALRRMRLEWGIRGIEIVVPRWPADSRVYHLFTPQGFRYLAECERLGILNIHLHPGDGVSPLDRTPFDVEDLDRAASSFPNLNFIVEHGGLPWFEEFCWIATRELNVYAGLATIMPFVLSNPRHFADLLSELLFWLGPDRLIFACDYALWAPCRILDAFVAFELPTDLRAGIDGELLLEVKRQILGENLAHLYGVKIPQIRQRLESDLLARVVG